MKYDKKEPETMDADPMRLLVSAILAFTVMLFINGFVGSMGGFPAFVAFTLVVFRIRTRAGMENGGMQQELSDRQITGRLLWKYAVGYLVLWGILRIAFLISRVTGWGNINGASAVEYVRQMWNTSLLEKWAYFFAGMIMFAFVLSLFPLAVIREKVRWIRYALVDGAVFALVCLGINGVCRLKFEQKSSGRATCLIDHLLLFVVADSIRRYVSKFRKFTYAVHGYSSFIFCINLSLYSPCKKSVFIHVWRSFSSMSANRRLISENRGSSL